MAAATLELVHAVEAEVTAVQRFLALLEREQDLLVKGEVDELIDLARQKNELAAQITALGSRRTEALAAAGLPADRPGIDAWLAVHPSETRARDAWNLLMSLAGQAHEVNRANGELIQIRMQHNAQALEALLGSNASLTLYGPDGQNTPTSGRRISDSA